MIAPHTASARVRSFPINIVSLAPDPDKTITSERAQKFVATLNNGFRSRSGGLVFKFNLKTFYRVDELDSQYCSELIALGDQAVKPSKSEVERAFDNFRDPRIVDHTAINTYLFSSSFDNGEKKSSRIYFHRFEPFVFMNIDRLDNDWRVWEHEFGHVFGLLGLSACGSTPDTPTNVMTEISDSCEGTGGNRKLGFELWQVSIMKTTAAIIAKRIGVR